MKKIIIIILAIIILAVIVTLVILNIENVQNQEFNSKISIIQEYISNNEEYKDFIESGTNQGVIISVSDGNSRAIVRYAKSGNIEDSILKSKKEIQKHIQKNNYEPKWIKIDYIKNIQNIQTEDIEETIENLTINGMFKYGLMFKENNIDIVLTAGELNSNNIIDYETNSINKDNLNKYLITIGQKKIENMPDSINIFDTISFFCDDDNIVYSLYNSGIGTGRRVIDINDKQIQNLINTSKNYLYNMIKENGQFIYGYEAANNKEIEGYSILRHAGSVWSLILTYNENEDIDGSQKEKIDKAIGYLINNIVYPNEGIAYIMDEEKNEIVLGGNGLALVAICEYINKFEDNSQYLKIANELGEGIINMQKENGQFVHVLNPNNYNVLANYRSVFYDGEATLALCKLYSITEKDRFLRAAEKAMDYFIDDDYLFYKDHWLSYAANDLTKYLPKKEYFEFGLRNIGDNLYSIASESYTSATLFEQLMQCYELYERMEEKNINSEYANKFTKDNLEDMILERANIQLNSYLFPEIAMYLENPSKFVNTFCVMSDNYRIRIDDIQHSITGYYYYLNSKLG